MANVQTAMRQMGLAGMAERDETPPAPGLSDTGRLAMERCAQPSETSGNTHENTAMCPASSPMNSQHNASPATIATAW